MNFAAIKIAEPYVSKFQFWVKYKKKATLGMLYLYRYIALWGISTTNLP